MHLTKRTVILEIVVYANSYSFDIMVLFVIQGSFSFVELSKESVFVQFSFHMAPMIETQQWLAIFTRKGQEGVSKQFFLFV